MVTALVLAAALRTSPVTGALYAAGGGAGSFSTVRALDAMFGAPQVEAELIKLRAQYGATSPLVDDFDFAMHDAWQRAGRADVSVRSTPLAGRALARAIVRAGLHKRTFSVQRLFGTLFPPQIAGDVLLDVDTKYGTDQTAQFRTLANQFFADMGNTVGETGLKGAAAAR